jgi:hypothetical protein
VVDGGYFHRSIRSVDETGVSRYFKFKVVHHQVSPFADFPRITVYNQPF